LTIHVATLIPDVIYAVDESVNSRKMLCKKQRNDVQNLIGLHVLVTHSSNPAAFQTRSCNTFNHWSI